MMLFGQLSAPELVEESHAILARAKERFRPKATFCMFSGGNDSTTLLHIIHQHVDAAVHIRTGIGIESTFTHVQQVCERLGVKLIVLQTDPETYRKIILRPNGKGFPGPALHYICYHHLKQRRIRELQMDYSRRGEKLLLVSGVRRKESKRRARSADKKEWSGPDHEATRCVWANPLVNADGSDMIRLREQFAVPMCMAAALIHKSGECLCGAFAKPGELEEIEFWFPDVGRKIRALEKEATMAGKPYCQWGHGKVQGEAKPVGPLCQGCSLFPDAV